ncbi:unnamed protein product [Lota lota]
MQGTPKGGDPGRPSAQGPAPAWPLLPHVKAQGGTSSASVLDLMDHRKRLVYPLALRTRKRVLMAPCMSVSSVQSL